MLDSKSNYNDLSNEDLTIELEKWKKRFQRERLQRKEAELLLENKSREVYDANQKLEKIVVKKTDDYNSQVLENTKNLKLLSEYKKAVDASFIVSKTDKNGIITYVNEAFIKISGYSQEELIGNSHNVIMHNDTPEELYYDMWSTIKKKQIWLGEFKNKAKNGKPYYVTSTIVPILDDNDEIEEFIGLRYDITNLIEAKEKAYTAQKAKESFFANMSHEIRTPLNAIIGFSDLLKLSFLKEEDEKHVNIINQSAKDLLNLINDILDFSKINSGKFTIELIAFDLKQSIEHLVVLLKLQAKNKNISLNLNFDNNIPKCLKVDPNRLKQILTNLLSNAIKFTHEEGCINLNIKLIEKNKKAKIYFEVKDNGIGIDEKNIKKIFDPFLQSENTATKNHKGTGLGLSITSSLIDMMGGRLEVKSKLKEGSSFFFTLEFEVLNENLLTPKKEDFIFEKVKLEGKVLVAEDNTTNQILITKLLQNSGLDLEIANNGKEALEFLEKESFNLILMDINMPVMNGFEALKTIKEDINYKKFKNIPIIAVTANALVEEKKEIQESGFDDYLSKPIDYIKLNSLLQRYIHIENTKIELIQENTKTNAYLENLIESFHIDEKTAHMLFDNFYTTCFKDIDNLKLAIEQNIEKDIKSISHTLKGTSLNLRLDEIGNYFKYIEKNPLNKDLLKYLEKAKSNLEEVLEELKQHKEN